jgi:hypothetical protein
MAHCDEIGSANIPAIAAERSVSEKKLLMFMALKRASAAHFYSCRGEASSLGIMRIFRAAPAVIHRLFQLFHETVVRLEKMMRDPCVTAQT